MGFNIVWGPTFFKKYFSVIQILNLRVNYLLFSSFEEHVSDSEVMKSSMTLHHSVVHCEKGRVCLVEEVGPGPVSQEEGVFRRAAAVLMCASYRNPAIHVFTRPAMVAVAMTTAVNNRMGV